MMEQKWPLPLEYVSRMSWATEWSSGPAALAINRSRIFGFGSRSLYVSSMSMCIVGPA